MTLDLKTALAERRKAAEEALRINLCLSRDIVEEFEDLAAERTQIIAVFERRRNELASRRDDTRMGEDPANASAAIDAEQATATADIDARIADVQARGTEHTVQLVFAVVAPSQYQEIVNKHTTAPGEIDVAAFFPALAKEAFRRVEQAGAPVDLGTWDEISESLSFGEVDAIRQQVWMANRGTVAAPFLAEILREQPLILADVEEAHSLGISLKRFHGWEPKTWIRDGYLEREPEWDPDERDIMRARKALEMDRCPGCGGWLSQTLTDQEPVDDHPDHYYAIEPLWCRKCIAHDQWREANAEIDRQSAGTIADRRVTARRIVSEARPLPTT